MINLFLLSHKENNKGKQTGFCLLQTTKNRQGDILDIPYHGAK
jgi:hypothetical protein